MSPSSSARQFLRTSGMVALAISSLFTVDTFLAKTEESEGRVEAARLFAEGQSLLERGHNTEAAERLQDALAIERHNRDYQLALAQAQLASGQFSDAETTLTGLLLSDSTNGPANLTMARVLVKEGRFREAISYYHRAVFGEWASSGKAADAATDARSQVRFELIDLLAQQGSKEELLAELLAVEDQSPGDIPTRLRIGRLFLAAGSPDRAADVFRKVVRDQRSNGEAYDGLGEADFARGDYRAAINDFSSALKQNPGDQAATKRLALSNEVLELDPTRRGLDDAERFRRSRTLLQMTIDASTACLDANPQQATLDLLDRARKSLKQRAAAHPDEGAETNLGIAEKLWQTRRPGCQAIAADSPLALVMARANSQ